MSDCLAYDLGFFMEGHVNKLFRTYEQDGRALLDGPLSDLSILVQVPAVRKLAQEHLRTFDFHRNDPETAERWAKALEATDG